MTLPLAAVEHNLREFHALKAFADHDVYIVERASSLACRRAASVSFVIYALRSCIIPGN